MNEDRKGDWILTFTGKKFWPLDPRPEDVCIEDVAHALSNLCRFGGHTLRFYSVAEHSVLVSRLVPSEHAFPALLHDAPEAYLMDLPRPLKRMLPAYGEADNLVWRTVASHFRVSSELPPDVKKADNDLLAVEACHLMRTPELIVSWLSERESYVYVLGSHPNVPALGLLPREAERLFLDRYYELLGNRHAA